MSRLTIFGGSGYVGGSFYDFFVNNNNKNFTSLDLILRSVKEKFTPKKNINLIQYDLEKNQGDLLPTGSDVVLYAVDNTDYDLYEKKISYQLPNKIINFKNLVKNNFSKSKILFVSSGSVYGIFDQEKKVDEKFIHRNIDSIPVQKKFYVHNKRLVENEFKKMGEEGFNVSIARCFTFIGPRIPLDKHFLIGNFINNFIEKKKISANSKKKVIRSYMFWQDMVEWLIMIAGKSSSNCPVYNVGSDKEISIDEMLQIFEEIGGIISKRENISNEFDYYVPSVDKSINELNLKLNRNFKDNLLKTLEDIKNIINKPI